MKRRFPSLLQVGYCRRSIGLLLFTLAACHGPSPEPDLGRPTDLRAAQDLARSVDLAGGYPAGPYGNEVGQTLPLLVWEGYLNPTAEGLANTAPYGPYSMDDLRRSGKKYALLYAADYF